VLLDQEPHNVSLIIDGCGAHRITAGYLHTTTFDTSFKMSKIAIFAGSDEFLFSGGGRYAAAAAAACDIIGVVCDVAAAVSYDDAGIV
jgi:hypothetical protein